MLTPVVMVVPPLLPPSPVKFLTRVRTAGTIRYRGCCLHGIDDRAGRGELDAAQHRGRLCRAAEGRMRRRRDGKKSSVMTGRERVALDASVALLYCPPALIS